MPQYKFSGEAASKIHKHGIDLTIFNENVPQVNVVHISVELGHLQEFFDTVSYYIYFIIQGKGVFVLNDEKVAAKSGDLIVIPPNTRIHYFGKMEMTLTVSPAYEEGHDTHVRFVDPSESPFLQKDNLS